MEDDFGNLVLGLNNTDYIKLIDKDTNRIIAELKFVHSKRRIAIRALKSINIERQKTGYIPESINREAFNGKVAKTA